jgi:hypothetical protein
MVCLQCKVCRPCVTNRLPRCLGHDTTCITVRCDASCCHVAGRCVARRYVQRAHCDLDVRAPPGSQSWEFLEKQHVLK